METKEEAKLWDALQLLTKAEYVIGAVAVKLKAEEKDMYCNIEKARKKIREAEVMITLLRK